MNKLNYNFNIYCDAPEKLQIFFQDPATPDVLGMLYFVNFIHFYLTIIFCLIFYFLVCCFLLKKIRPYKIFHSSSLEIVWTLTPAVILTLIAFPSFALLASIEAASPGFHYFYVKIIGNQWYWVYSLNNEYNWSDFYLNLSRAMYKLL